MLRTVALAAVIFFAASPFFAEATPDRPPAARLETSEMDNTDLLRAEVRDASSDSARASWPLNSITTTSATAAGAIEASSQTVTSTYIIRDYQGTQGSQRVYAAGSGLGYWPPETDLNPNRYAEFEVAPMEGVDLVVTQVSLSVGNSGGTHEHRAAVRYSTDGFETWQELAARIEITSNTIAAHTYDLSAEVPEGTTFTLRVYPWHSGAESGRYFNLANVEVAGTTTGEPVIAPPTVSTGAVTFISTTFARAGGTVSADGGAPVEARGVVWSTSPNPTLDDNATMDGQGTGSFNSEITGLTPGTTYYLRAYATNSGGTGYGSEASFTTRSELSVPEVATTSVSNILTTSAVSGGLVADHGGAEVIARGVCWNTTGSPTLEHSCTIDGQGTGLFNSFLAGLSPETTYYVRAYGTNAVGTGYGNERSFTTVAPAPPINITVAKDGSGDYETVQAAFDAIPERYTGPITVFVKKGVYYEKILLAQHKINVTLIGEDRDETVLTYDDYAGRVVDGVTIGTATSYSTAIDADDFVARDITFQNTSEVAQAVALRVRADRVAFYSVNMLGFQDTYYTWGEGRIYHRDCYIEGTVDFIFGRSIAVFEDCTLHSKRNSPITAASTEQNYRFGYVFFNATLTADPGIDRVHLGRPWREYGRTVFIDSHLGDHIMPAGWLEWAGTENHLTAYYAEYNNTGPGFRPDDRVWWSHQLTAEEAAEYTVENIFSRNSVEPAFPMDWMPDERTTSIDDIGAELPGDAPRIRLLPNHPNPFSGSTTISFELNDPAAVRLTMYNVLGQEVRTLVDEQIPAGRHAVPFDAGDLSSGVYFYRIQAGSDRVTGRMMLLMR